MNENDCPTCKGEGIVKDPHITITAPSTSVCPTCKGTGLKLSLSTQGSQK